MVKDNQRKDRSRQVRPSRSGAERQTSPPPTKPAGEIAHELGNILMSISFSCTQLLAGIPENSPLRAMASAIAQDAAEARSLSQALRNMVKRRAPAEPVDLNQSIEEAKTRLRGLIPANIELIVVASETPVLVEAEPEDVERIITNLVINVCDVMASAGTLTIRVEQLSQPRAMPHLPTVVRNFARLTIEHPGHRIRSEGLNALSPPAGKSPSEQLGMELAIVDAIVTRNDGYVEVENGEQSVTKISVLLPQKATGTASKQSHSPQDKSA
jgi:two-component system, cell cycle sensor histidine kinase and response regulator CckA